MKENLKNKKTIISMIIGAATLLLVTIGAAYAYVTSRTSNDATETNTTGALKSIGNVTLTTNTNNLYLNLDEVLLSQDNIGTTYYATKNSNGVPITNASLNNGIYTLATASLSGGETPYNCTYNYDITGTLTNPISDGSDEDIKVTFKGKSIENGSVTYTLKQILEGNVTLSGTFRNIATGKSKTITIESTVDNTDQIQDDYLGNSYSITITPKSGSEGFSCEATTLSTNLAQRLIDGDNMWQSGLDGDGYRFTGSGNNYATTTPSNFICFGTKDLTTCKANEGKYLYRIIGVFQDTSNNDSVKLIKYQRLSQKIPWHSDMKLDISWENSDLYHELNGSSFLTSDDFSYMQNTDWLNKIANWTWSAVNTKTHSDGGPQFYNMTAQQFYLYEMNKPNKISNIGTWTTPTAKIGLMYASDYLMSLGSSSLNLSSNDSSTLKTGWLYHFDHYENEYTLSREGYFAGWYNILALNNNGAISNYSQGVVRPVFYLTPDVEYASGTGTYADPIIIK